MKLDDIDLNSGVVPVEANDDVHGSNSLESSTRARVSATQTLIGPSGYQSQVAGYTIDGVVNEGEDFEEADGSAEGCRGVEKGLEAEIDNVDRGSDAKEGNASVSRFDGDSCGKEGGVGGEIATNDGRNDLGVKVEENCGTVRAELDVDRGLQSVTMRKEGEKIFFGFGEKLSRELTPDGGEANEFHTGEVEATYRGQDQVTGVCHSDAGVSQQTGYGSNMIRLVVDLSHCPSANVEFKSGNGIGNEGEEINEIPSSGGLADNLASCINGIGVNGNQDVVIEKLVTYMEQPEITYKKEIKPSVFKLQSYGKEPWIEKAGEYNVTDLVWGKVRSHPWWPGQIFDHSAASDRALKYFRKSSFLIAYFGDQTFAWNEVAQIKPFWMHFSRMEKQSNAEVFHHAIDCALDEISRRVEFGLACPCLSEEVYAKIKTQVVVNAGIREESSRRDGEDNFSSAASFIPSKLVQYLEALAQAPYDSTDRLEFVIVRSQLLAFNRWKGYYQLPMLKVFEGLLENDVDLPVLGEEKDLDDVIEDAVPGSNVDGDEQVSLGKGNSSIRDSSSQKRKQVSSADMCLSKKERRMSDLMCESCSSLPNGENISEEKPGRKITSLSSGKKRNVVHFIPNDSSKKSRSSDLSRGTVSEVLSPPKRSFRVASELAESTLKCSSKQSQKTVGKKGGKHEKASSGVKPTSSERSKNIEVTPAEYPPSDEMLSHLCLAAIDPIKGYDLLIPVVKFSSDFRNSFCLENSKSAKDKKSTGKVSGKLIGKKSSYSGITETSGFEGMKDAYWTDRIIQGNPEEQVLFEPDTPFNNGAPTVEPGAAVVNLDLEADKSAAGHLDEQWKEYSPTALVLNFTDLDSVPSESNLNKIFSRFGPLNELETEVMNKSNRAKVVFKRRPDAETAFSSAGKFSIFGPSLVSYRLNYSPTPRKTSKPAAKRNRKDASSAEGNTVED